MKPLRSRGIPSGFWLVMCAQFFSSLADNALLIAAIALIQQLHGPAWVAPLAKWSFAVAYVVLAPYVGAFADTLPKGRVMFVTNLVKVTGCLMMFFYGSLGLAENTQVWLVLAAYTVVGIGAAAYSPAKYGIVTEMLAPADLIKGNSWIEGLTVISILLGVMLGGALIHPDVSDWLLNSLALASVQMPAEAAILVITAIYGVAAGFNLLIPRTGVHYPPQHRSMVLLAKEFSYYARTLWRDRLGQISLAVTTLFWGAGATLQLVVIEWGAQHLGLGLDQSSLLMGLAALGTILGATLAARVPLKQALSVLPIGVVMGLVVLLMPAVKAMWAVYALLILVGALGGFYVVPMNALLQHRGHVLLSAGHSIAVQNFNEQLSILLLVGVYSLLLWLQLPINMIIVLFGLLVAAIMVLIIIWNRHNQRANPKLNELIGQEGHGAALRRQG